jgi:5'-nucleotidase
MVQFAVMSETPLRILVANDDGVQAPGLLILKQALERAGHQVTVCAPDRPRSASGHAITLHKPLRISQHRLADDSLAFATSGTPADCVTLGMEEILKNQLDVVVSGINHGPNLGWDVTYSGTVSAAMEAVINGFPAIAVSVASYEETMHYEPVAEFVAQTLAPQVYRNGLPAVTLLNVNAPNVPAQELKGVRVTVQGDRQYVDRIERRVDPVGRPYYWLGGKIHDKETAEGSDTRAVGEGYISVTPIHLDLTAHEFVRHLREWEIES